jgi:flagellar hook-associated protein 1 FlgK
VSSLGLNIGLKSLLTAQASLESIGHNLANASTPGYSRQRLEVSTSPVLRLGGLLQGTGVSADVVRRTTDVLLHARLVRQMSSVSRLDARLDTMGQAESFMGGVEGLLQNFFDGISTL